MKIKSIHIATGVMMGLLWAGGAVAADQPVNEAPYASVSEIQRCCMSGWSVQRDRLNKQGFDMEMKS
jgi:hypothetical protein